MKIVRSIKNVVKQFCLESIRIIVLMIYYYESFSYVVMKGFELLFLITSNYYNESLLYLITAIINHYELQILIFLGLITNQ